MSIYISGDISKCANKACPLKDDCYRFRAISRMPNYQVYSGFQYDETDGCRAFVRLSDEEKQELQKHEMENACKS